MKIAFSVWGWDYTDAARDQHYRECLQCLLDNKNPQDTVQVFIHEGATLRPQPEGVTVCPVLKRHAVSELGVKRDLPFLKELLGTMAQTPCDLFGYLNSDILMDKACMHLLRNGKGAYAFSRYDIAPCSYADFQAGNFKITHYAHSGFDAVFFTPSWWRRYSQVLPYDLLIGEGVWDNYYDSAIRAVTPKQSYSGKHLYHREHVGGSWSPSSLEFESNDRVRQQYPVANIKSLE
jgi:hypothetical protein